MRISRSVNPTQGRRMWVGFDRYAFIVSSLAG
jgi:hypothetical protein